MIVPMKGHVVQTAKHAGWYEVVVHVPVFEGIDGSFSDTFNFDVAFDDAVAPAALKLIEKGSKR